MKMENTSGNDNATSSNREVVEVQNAPAGTQNETQGQPKIAAKK